jgi:hypothetical protein
MTHTDQTIQTFLNSAQAVVNDAVEAARLEAPNDFAGLAGVMRAGGLLKLVATFAHLTNQALVQVVITEPNGNEHVLSQKELFKESLQ